MHLRALQVALVQAAVRLEVEGLRQYRTKAEGEIGHLGAVLEQLLGEYSKNPKLGDVEHETNRDSGTSQSSTGL